MRSARDALEQALAILRRDALAAYFRVVEELHGTVVQCAVEGETFAVASDGTAIRIEAAGTPPDVVVATRRSVILALLEGRAAVLDTVLARQLALRGDADVLPRIARASQAFTEGSLRSRAARGLLEQLRAEWAGLS